MEDKFHLKIVTPEGIKIDDNVIMLTIRTSGGYQGILRDHTPILAAIEIGICSIRKNEDGKEEEFFLSGGFMNVEKEKTTIISDYCEEISKIDVSRIKQLEENIREEMKNTSDRKQLGFLEKELQKTSNLLSIVKTNKSE